ncbi:MAG: hypothetical protein IOC92_17120 [Rhodobacter sp.]|nr:hypothetical protein [Rhodobacter sp.]MCA3458569.1 hypothetical protein [Rhodobacter sp.]MCA3460541.1 hypothetical protein [Rhodobacter sp.]MCA3463163.1 hypothetical protein [Rhodobacter sp.]MCA3468782.1 hypothetical protein [Rhodobacter sp.]
MADGVIYVAEGSDYLDLAVQSARSLKALNPEIPIDLFTDQAMGTGLFDSVKPIPAGPTAKLASLPVTRFDRTLYLDCDTLCLAPLDDLFDILTRFELAIAHDVRRTSDLIREGAAESPPYAFPQMNAGVMLYRRSTVMRGFLRDWQKAYAAAGKPRDQPTLRDLLWSSDLRFYVLPPEFNLRRVTVLDAWEPLDARPTILHSHRLLQHLRGAPDRLTTLTEILPAERLARAEEWRRCLVADPAQGGDAVAAYHSAEAALTGRERPQRDGTATVFRDEGQGGNRPGGHARRPGARSRRKRDLAP